MPRPISHILAISALVVQFWASALPGGESCVCIPVAEKTPDCCCDDGGERVVTVERSCPYRNGCKSCICVAKPDNRATLSARSQPNIGPKWPVAAMLYGAPAPLSTFASHVASRAPRPTESPPHLGPMRTTRLTI